MFYNLGRRYARAIKEGGYDENRWFIVIVTITFLIFMFIIITGIVMVVLSRKV